MLIKSPTVIEYSQTETTIPNLLTETANYDPLNSVKCNGGNHYPHKRVQLDVLRNHKDD